ncbi:phosphotransferase family protein [Sphingomonas sp. SRS2]|uniref:phosphotransferase family protein n=1 Tax=Sphingomonas sp. SRS2 TaxID=133190 RepID=UPI0006184C0D|nr:phosphotransferase family protein [Sphingomonas sp. SRS2]KKC25221.1 hypothetical protein WP12_15230 [Sphingomonas sp. SRS2]
MRRGKAPDPPIETSGLPPVLVDAVERATARRIVSFRRHVGGGASREGAYLELDRDGDRIDAFLAYDVRRASDTERADFIRREAAALQLAHTAGLPVPEVLASFPELRAILMRRADGAARFDDKSVEHDVSLDYMAQLAALHRVPIDGAGPTALGEPAETAQDHARRRIAEMRLRHGASAECDPLLSLLYRWLEENIPSGEVRTVLVHGDAGPGNFLHADRRVTALLDWELAHFGDAMEDLAWLTIRSAIVPFTPIGLLLAAYRAAGGQDIDEDRIRYWRLICHAAVITDQFRTLRQEKGTFGGTLGAVLTYNLLHRRLAVEALAECCAMPLPPVAIAEVDAPSSERFYEIALDDLRERIVPRVDDNVARDRMKGLARVIKFWKSRNRLGPALDEIERVAISEALARPFAALSDADTALANAIDARDIPVTTAIGLLHQRVSFETAIGSDLLGALADRHYEKLS